MLIGIGIEHHLHYPLAIAQVEENDATVVPPAINPTTEGDRFINISCTQGATIMTAHSLDSV
jgi:hypothetical protein